MSYAFITRRGGGSSEKPTNGLTLKAKVIESDIEANTWGELVIDDAEATTEYVNPAGDAEFIVSNIIPGTTNEVYLVKNPNKNRTLSYSAITEIEIARARMLEKSYELISSWKTLERSYFTTRKKLESPTSSTSSTIMYLGRVFDPYYRGQIFALTSNKIIIVTGYEAITGVYDSSTKIFTFSSTYILANSNNISDSYFGALNSDIFLSSDNSEIIGVTIQRLSDRNFLGSYSIGVTLAGDPSIVFNNLGFKSGIVSLSTERWLPINREKRIYGSSYNVIQFNTSYNSYDILKSNSNGALLVDISNSKFFNRKYYTKIADSQPGNMVPETIPMEKYFTNYLPNDMQGHNGKVIYLIKKSQNSAVLPNPYSEVAIEYYAVVDYNDLDAPVIVDEFAVPEKYSVYPFSIYSNALNNYVHNIVKSFNFNRMYIMTYMSRWDLPDSNDVYCSTTEGTNLYEARTVGVVRIMEYNLISGKIKLLPFIRGFSAQSPASFVSFSGTQGYNFGFTSRLLPYLNDVVLYASAAGKVINSKEAYPDKGTKIIDFNKYVPYKIAPLRYNDPNKYYPREKALALEAGAIGDDIEITFGGY